MRAVGRWWRFLLPISIALAAFLAQPQPAPATFHEILVREVYAGGASNDSYVVVQAYTGNQNSVYGHGITAYEAGGTSMGSFTFSAGVGNGATQMTILIADTAYASSPTPDGTMAALNLNPAGGAVCWTSYDCVSWGSFSGATSPSAGTPAVAMSGGQALHRSIAANCSTLLEFNDDTPNSSADFSLQTPNPRSNSSAIVETQCTFPNTIINTATVPNGTRTKSQEIEFAFSANPSAGAEFECKREPPAASFAGCPSPQSYTGLDGDNAVTGTTHTFQVRAKNANGTDSSPATHTWTVDLVGPTATIVNKPPDPGPGNNASFTYNSNEGSSTFECSLEESGDPDAFSACPVTGKSYPDAQHPAPFADGDWTFKVRAKDQVGNQGTATAYTWTVDNSLTDEDPPETTILMKPADPSESAIASFTYSSDEPNSTFECKLDGEGFASCPAAGKTYSNVTEGAHTFQVRAKDEFDNADPSPAGHSWSISLPSPIEPPPLIPPTPPLLSVPETTFTLKPRAVTPDRTPTFRFRSNIAGASYACKVDRAPFKFCRSPFTTKALKFGPHRVQVRAAAGGVVDPTPARHNFKVAKAKKKRKAKR